MKNKLINLNVFVLSLISFYILFSTLNDLINVEVYILLTCAIWFLISINFKRKLSEDMFCNLSFIYIGSAVSLIISKINSMNIWHYFFSIKIVGFSIFLFLRCLLVKYDLKGQEEDKELMRKRKFDLERIEKYLNQLNIIAINAKWGDGKTFLVNKLKDKVEKEYEIIEIDVLSCNLDELQLVLIKEIEKILYKNKMLSKYSRKLRNFFNGEFRIKNMFGINFIDNPTYLQIIKGFKEDLEKIDKKILIIYEDLDRITNVDVIKSIFAISENISGNKVKIIYEYDEENLKKLKFDNYYLEKYMPYKINLTKLNFFEILKFKLKEMKIDESKLCIKDFEFLEVHNMELRFRFLDKPLDSYIKMQFELNTITIRKIEHFITEINLSLLEINDNDVKDTVISFYYIKHFIPEVYDKLISNQGLLETLMFKVNMESETKEYTFLELIDLFNLKKLEPESINEIFDIDENKLNYFILKLFDYNIEEEVMKVGTKRERIYSSDTESVNHLINRVKNDKKNRVIWWLLESGKSKLTDYEYEAKIIINDVLSKDTYEDMKKAYYEFCNHMYTLDSYEYDNSTTQMMGESMIIEVFKAFNIREITEDEQFKLLTFFLKLSKITDITDEVICILNLCKLRTRSEYISILKEFNKLNVVGNFNNKVFFLNFIKKYIGVLSNSNIGFCRTHGISSIHNDQRTGIDKIFTKNFLMEIKDILIEEKQSINKIKSIKEVNEDFDVILKFIDKISSLIDEEKEFIIKKGNIKFDYKAVNPNEEEFERLKSLCKDNDENFANEILKSYKSGKITPYELAKLNE